MKNTIAFTGVTTDGKGALWFVDAQGINAHSAPPIDNLDQIYYPTWLSDHEVVVMNASDLALRVIDFKKGSATPITDKNLFFAGRPSVSIDGKKIAFAGQINAGQRYDQEKNSIWLMPLHGKPHLLEMAPLQGRSPDLSPDGNRVTFESDRGDGHVYAVFVASSDGRRVQPVTDGKFNAYHPGWSPNGEAIVFAARHDESRKTVNIAIIRAP
jgi:Tol biopolymer transport system component